MRLTFHAPFLSIKEFPSVELPSFTLVTGLNGTGKTHLLRAIEVGQIRCDIASPGENQIRYFDWNSLLPQDSGSFDGHTIEQERSHIAQTYFDQVRIYIDQVVNTARTTGLSGRYLTDPHLLFSVGSQALLTALGDPAKAHAAEQAIRTAVESATSQFLNNGSIRQYQRQIELTAKSLGRSVLDLRRDELLESPALSWGQADIFQQSFSRLFVAYRDLHLSNSLKQLTQEKTGQSVGADLSPKLHPGIGRVSP